MLTAAEFRSMHRPGDPFVLPNAWDLASARWLHAAGHPLVGTTSLGVAFASGRADGTGETAAETFDIAERIVAAGIPATVDIEAGFSDDPDEVGRFVERLARIGVVGVNIEDSDQHGRLLEPEAVARKIAAIASAAPELYLNARTDPFWIAGDSDVPTRTREVLGRSHRYLDAGASGIFIPGSISLDVVATLTNDIPAPVNVLVQPRVAVRELAAAGVARISTGSLLFRVALQAIADAARTIIDGSYVPDAATPSYGDVAKLRLPR